MRAAFIRSLGDLAAADDRIVLLTGDLGFRVVEPFVERFPKRFFNLGVAEQNMVGVATGLAEDGFVPFVYSIVNFVALRPYEFIRNGPVAHNLAVRIVGVGGGFEYGSAGPTHHGLEDVAIMRAQPGMAVLVPADHDQAAAAVLATRDIAGPAYIRLGKNDHAVVVGLGGRFRLGRPEVIRQGADVAIVTMGAITTEALAAAKELALSGIEATVILVASVNPCDAQHLRALLAPFNLVVTVEAHSVVGGLGSLVCEVVAEAALPCRVVRCGVRRRSDGTHTFGGSESYLNELHGLSSETLAATVTQELRSPGREDRLNHSHHGQPGVQQTEGGRG